MAQAAPDMANDSGAEFDQAVAHASAVHDFSQQEVKHDGCKIVVAKP